MKWFKRSEWINPLQRVSKMTVKRLQHMSGGLEVMQKTLMKL